LWRQPMRHLLLSTEVDDAEGSILKEIVPDMESLLAYAVPDAPPLKGDAHQERLFTAISTVLKRVTSPVVLIVEDLQWAQDSLQPLQHLMHEAAAYPLLLIANFRDDDAPDLPEKISAMQRITLSRLDDAAIVKLSQSILGTQGASDKVVELLQRETEGNVFFIIETIRALAEEVGRLGDIGTKTLPRNILTGGVQAVVKRRLDRLPQTIRDWLKAVAIAGRQLDPALVQHLHGQSSEGMLDFLRQCADAAVMEVRENNWRFAHDKIRETIITHLDDRERRQLHEQVATAIEAQYPDVNAYHEILLEHWYQAGNLEKELHYLRLLTVYMVDTRGDYDKARTLINHRLTRLPDADPRRAFFLNKMGDSYWNQGRYDEGRTVTEQAHQLATQHNLQAEIAHSLRILGVIASQEGNPELGKDYFEQSLAIFRELGDKTYVATLLIYIGSALNLQEKLVEAREYYEQALPNLRNGSDHKNLELTLSNLGIIAYKQGDYTLAKEYFHEAESIQQAAGVQYRAGHIILWSSINLFQLHDNTAYDQLLRGLAIARKISSVSLKLFGVIIAAFMLFDQEKFELAALWTSCVQVHPAIDITSRYFVVLLTEELQTVMTIEAFTRAMENGKRLVLDEVVALILEHSALVNA
jgi:predicted ATPase